MYFLKNKLNLIVNKLYLIASKPNRQSSNDNIKFKTKTNTRTKSDRKNGQSQS